MEKLKEENKTARIQLNLSPLIRRQVKVLSSEQGISMNKWITDILYREVKEAWAKRSESDWEEEL